MTKERINNLKARELIEGALKTVRNAQQLCDESELLYQHKMFARSYALSHLAREEIGKSAMLFKVAIDCLLGNQIDWKKVDRRFRSHKEKIMNDRALTFLLFGHMKAEGRKLDPNILFNSGTVEYMNARKNASIYVDWMEGKFISPEESVSEQQSARNLDLAIYRVALMSKVIPSLVELEQKSKDEIAKIFPMKKIIQFAEDLQDEINSSQDNQVAPSASGRRLRDNS
ncbi:TPA: AbiV family abortive infection protein [Pasteurella multocida]|uniref:AbiV family abortive infection protein n=1 Tax=Pasteurella multocida TaxID=747 RepID=UPI0028DEF895|nr:AbiV family abortive infection protein [Pasteurella multocida]MDY0499295.1 AbiV family abortive infection protein [Pasteurella multocida]MDY0654779.1 AbiV family abortive infection protein [Pasteurella multocida]WRU41075.1 AbiV family abortive infection protein [Pasteurella multocida]HDR1920103.1 AbiV family abortive infection protein [Pasteurella multocida]HEA3244520.1 AbiV family abortive infection protein [Pasteurella multocida]